MSCYFMYDTKATSIYSAPSPPLKRPKTAPCRARPLIYIYCFPQLNSPSTRASWSQQSTDSKVLSWVTSPNSLAYMHFLLSPPINPSIFRRYSLFVYSLPMTILESLKFSVDPSFSLQNIITRLEELYNLSDEARPGTIFQPWCNTPSSCYQKMQLLPVSLHGLCGFHSLKEVSQLGAVIGVDFFSWKKNQRIHAPVVSPWPYQSWFHSLQSFLRSGYSSNGRFPVFSFQDNNYIFERCRVEIVQKLAKYFQRWSKRWTCFFSIQDPQWYSNNATGCPLNVYIFFSAILPVHL